MKPAFNSSRKLYFVFLKAETCANDLYKAYKKQKGKVTDITERPWPRNNEHSDSFQMVDSFQRTEHKGG
jgi:hypothetical protein